MYFNWINILLLIAAAQSVFLAVFFFHKYSNSTANRFFALVMFSYAVVLIYMLLWDKEVFLVFPKLMIATTGTAFLVGPLYYLYSKFLSHTAARFSKRDWLHFIPFIVYELLMIPSFIQSPENLIANLTSAPSDDFLSASLLINWAVNIQTLTYMILTIWMIHKYSLRIKNIFSSIETIKLTWLRNITILFSFEVVLFLVENSFFTGGIQISGTFNLSTIMAALVIYALGYMGLMKSEIFHNPEFEMPITEYDNEDDADAQGSSTIRKYEKSGLTDEKADEYLEKLLNLMESDEPFRDSGITFNKLSNMLNISAHNLSEIINSKLNMNFFDFINKYRVEKVKVELLNMEKENYTLLAIALECGFNSKSSFNSVFKKLTNLTPTQYKTLKAAENDIATNEK